MGGVALEIPNHSGRHDAGTTSDPILPLQISNKQYVDAQIASNAFWQRVGTVLSPKNSGDTITAEGIELFKDGDHANYINLKANTTGINKGAGLLFSNTGNDPNKKDAYMLRGLNDASGNYHQYHYRTDDLGGYDNMIWDLSPATEEWIIYEKMKIAEDIYPYSTSTHDLGTASQYWAQGRINDLYTNRIFSKLSSGVRHDLTSSAQCFQVGYNTILNLTSTYVAIGDTITDVDFKISGNFKTAMIYNWGYDEFIFYSPIQIRDNKKIAFGSGSDVHFNFDGSNMWILPRSSTLRIGNISNYSEIKNDGEINLHGTARVKKIDWVGANAITGWFSNAASWVESGLTGVWEFSDGVSEKVSGTIKIPHDMERSVVPTFKIGWSANGSSPGNCRWQLEYIWISVDEDTTASAQETISTTGTASSTSNGFVFTSFNTIDLPSSTDKAMLWRLTRLGSSSSDTISDTVELRGIAFEYTANKLGEAT